MTDDDIRDAMLFRFWCKAATPGYGMVSDLAVALARCVTPEQYRHALKELALKHGVNLP